MSTGRRHEQARAVTPGGQVVWYGRWVENSTPGQYGYPGGLNDEPGAWQGSACFGCGIWWNVTAHGPVCPDCLTDDELARYGEPGVAW